MHYSHKGADGFLTKSPNNAFFGYNNQLDFRTPTTSTTITGKFGDHKHASYARLGGTAELTFIHR